MNQKELYEEFEALSKKMGLKIINGRGDFIGGNCIINNEKVIVINKLKPMENRLKILAISFLDYNLEGVYMVPYLRAFIENFRTLDL
mgnify:FL=1|tara:strand:+ start:1026 stop:1286 length:261 start_codon:yes stop_codon:yes gene_type:complete